MLSYFIYTVISLGSSYALYFFLLRKQKTFQFNRFFLLGSLLLCLLAPFLEIEIFNNIPDIIEIPVQTITESTEVFHDKENIVFGDVELVDTNKISPIFYVYLTISLVLLLRFIINIIKIYSNTRGNYERLEKLKIIRNTDSFMVSSFFNYVFIHKNQNLKDKTFSSILKHETIHCEQLHSLDVIMVELLICFFWFNPFIWFYKKSILQNHEYIADDKSISSGINIENYANTIINLGKREHSISLTSGFNFIQIKNRIIMLHQSKSSVLKRTFKITIAILLFTGIFGFSLYKQDPLSDDRPLIVVIDAAHGGKDLGAVSGNFNEKDIVLNISNQLSLLSNNKIQCIITREEDTFSTLKERVDVLNSHKADLVISLHCNANNTNASTNGVEAYYYDKNDFKDKSYAYSKILVESQMNLFSNNRGIKTANMYVLKHTKSPAVVLELGFITNKSDASILMNTKNQKEIAKSIFKGLLEIKNTK